MINVCFTGERLGFGDLLAGQLPLGLRELPSAGPPDGDRLHLLPAGRLLPGESLQNQPRVPGLHSVWLGVLTLHLHPALSVQNSSHRHGHHHHEQHPDRSVLQCVIIEPSEY